MKNVIVLALALIGAQLSSAAARLVYTCTGPNGRYVVETEACSDDKNVHVYSKMARITIADTVFAEVMGWNNNTVSYTTGFENNKSSNCSNNYCVDTELKGKRNLIVTGWENDEMTTMYATAAECGPSTLQPSATTLCITATPPPVLNYEEHP